MKKSVMILGAGLMQGPAIKAAKELGFNAFVVDANPNAACVKDADYFECVDLKDLDNLCIFADKINTGKDNCLAGVFTAGTDFSANTAYLAQKFSLFGHSYESCLNASNKVRMRKCFSNAGVPSPDFEEVDVTRLNELLELSRQKKITFPKVVKPVDNMGGRGCRLVRNTDELEQAVKHAIQYSRTSKAIFEDYMEGPEFSIDAVVYKGTLTITGFADRHIYYPPYFIETGHTMPSKCEKKIKDELIATFALGIKALGLTCGVAKADIKYTKNGPMIGEIAARLSGGYMSGWTFPYSSECFLTKEALKIACGLEPDFLLKNRMKLNYNPHESVKDFEQPFELFEIKSKHVSAERAWVSIPGKIKKITGYELAQNVKYVKNLFPRVKEGDKVNFPRNNVEKCGNIISLADDFDGALKACYEAINKITLQLELNNKDTEDFLNGYEAADEKGFPPSAFNVKIDFSKCSVIPKNKRVYDYIPDELKKAGNDIRDWNHCTFFEIVERFDLIFPEHDELDGKVFWKAALRGSLQGMLYVAKKN